jgi:hypothetical protein
MFYDPQTAFGLIGLGLPCVSHANGASANSARSTATAIQRITRFRSGKYSPARSGQSKTCRRLSLLCQKLRMETVNVLSLLCELLVW